MDYLDLEDEFSQLDLHIRQAQLLQEFIIDSEGQRRTVLDELITEVLVRAVEDAERFEAMLERCSQEFRGGSSLTTAAPITSTAPMNPSTPMCSRSTSADSSTATTGSM